MTACSGRSYRRPSPSERAPATPPLGGRYRKIRSPLKIHPRKNKAQQSKPKLRSTWDVSHHNWASGTFEPNNNGSALPEPELRESNGGSKMGSFFSGTEEFEKTYDARDVLERYIAQMEKMRESGDPNSECYGQMMRHCDCNLRKLRNLRDKLDSHMKSYCEAYDLGI